MVKSGYDIVTQRYKSAIQSAGYSAIKKEDYEKIYQELKDISKYDNEHDFNYLLNKNVDNTEFGEKLIKILTSSPELLNKNLEVLCDKQVTRKVIGVGFYYDIVKNITDEEAKEIDHGNVGITQSPDGRPRYYKTYFKFKGKYYLFTNDWYFWSKKNNKRSHSDNRT